MHYCGNSSVGRARPCQGRGRGFEFRFPLILKEAAMKSLPLCIYMGQSELAHNLPHINTKKATQWLFQDESYPPGGQDPPTEGRQFRAVLCLFQDESYPPAVGRALRTELSELVSKANNLPGGQI